MALAEVCDGRFSGDLSHSSSADHALDVPTLKCGWNCAQGRLEAFSDRLGFIPLFYWCEGPRIIISDSIRDLADLLPRISFDEQAVAAYMQLGYYIGDTTLLQGVKVISPASRLVWDGSLQIAGNGEVGRAEFSGSRDEAIEEYTRLFQIAISQRLGKTVGRLPLSGGRDSRHILLELLRQGKPPSKVLTLRRSNSTDHEVAQKLASCAGLECIEIVDNLDPFEIEHIKNQLNAYMADENGWYFALLDHLNGPTFDGLAGDVLSNGLYFNGNVARLMVEGHHEKAARLFLSINGGYQSYLSRACRKKFNYDMALDLISKEFARHQEMPNPLQSFVFWNRTRREISMLPISMARTKGDVLLPYTDRELLAFLLSLPFDKYGEPGLHDEVIRRAYPDLSGVTYSVKVKQKHGLLDRFSYTLKACARMLDPLSSVHRLAYYSFVAVARNNLTAIDNPFSRLYPLLQAQRDLGVEPPLAPWTGFML